MKMRALAMAASEVWLDSLLELWSLPGRPAPPASPRLPLSPSRPGPPLKRLPVPWPPRPPRLKLIVCWTGLQNTTSSVRGLLFLE